MKADDVIVRDVSFCHEVLHRDLMIVTADTELIKRCTSASNKSLNQLLSIVNPISFLHDLERIVDPWNQMDEISSEEVNKNESYFNENLYRVTDVEKGVALGTRYFAIETQMRMKGKIKSPSKLTYFN